MLQRLVSLRYDMCGVVTRSYLRDWRREMMSERRPLMTRHSRRRRVVHQHKETRLRVAYRLLQLERGDNVGIQHVRSPTRGTEALTTQPWTQQTGWPMRANMGAAIEEGHRVVERGSAEPPHGRQEHKDNG